MVRSILDGSINYPELRKLDDEDKEFDASVYESFLLGHDTLIALGQPKYAFIENSIVYYPVYLVKNQKVQLQIGVYEVLADRVPNIMDEDGDVELGLLDEPLLYSFVTKDMIERDEPIGDDGEDKSDDKSDSSDDEDKGEEDTESLPEQTLEESKLEKSQYAQVANQPWIQTFMKNNNFGIDNVAGDGDCLFTTIHEGLKSVGKDVSVNEMRKILADNVTEEIYLNYKIFYDNARSEYDSLHSEIKSLSKRHRELETRLKSTNDRKAEMDIITKASEVGKRHKSAKAERASSKEMMNEFGFMKGITGLESLKEIIIN